MGYTKEKLDGMSASLGKFPAIENRKRQYNKKEAIKLLAKDIASLRKRGYTLEQVAEALRGVGLDITERTLRNYLQQHKRPGKKTSARKAPAAKQEPAPQTAGSAETAESGEHSLADHKFSGDI